MNSRAKEAADRARARRRSAGLVAQYIHELSQRHAGARERSTPPPKPGRAFT